MQEVNRASGAPFSPVAPYVFTCPIGVEEGNADVQSRDWAFKECYFSERVPHTACVNAVKHEPGGGLQAICHNQYAITNMP